MLIKPPLEELLPKVESRYTLAMLVAKRTRQLVDGAQPMVPDEGKNLVTVACEEVMEDKVVGIPGDRQPSIPLRPEIEEARRLAREQAEAQAVMDAFPEVNVTKAIEQKVEEETTVIDVFNLPATDTKTQKTTEDTTEDTTEETTEDTTEDTVEGATDDSQEAQAEETDVLVEETEAKIEDVEEAEEVEIDDVSKQDVDDLKALDGADKEDNV